MNPEAIFEKALAIDSPVNRSRYLDASCGDNHELRQEIESLLAAHQAAGSFLEKSPGELANTRLLKDSWEESWRDLLEPSSAAGSLGRLQGYEVEELLGRGGMSVVLKARDPKLGRTVAIKLLAPELATNPMAVRRFLREAQAAAAISHPHVLTIHAIEENARPPFLVLEYVPGRSLQQKLDAQGSLDVKTILRIGMQTAAGLEAAHRQGLVHRDVKPSNILLENGVERVKLGDFGLARAVDDVGITRTGQITGTPLYMSPEQAKGELVDHRSDLFSLGCVLYALCTGRAAFRAESAVAVLHRVIHDDPKPIELVNPEIPLWLVEIVEVLLEKNPDHRFQTADEVANLLENHLAHLQHPETVPLPPQTVIRSRREDEGPSTVMEGFLLGIKNFAVQFAMIAGLFAVMFFIRSTIAGQMANITVIGVTFLFVGLLWLTQHWPKWTMLRRKHRDPARSPGRILVSWLLWLLLAIGCFVAISVFIFLLPQQRTNDHGGPFVRNPSATRNTTNAPDETDGMGSHLNLSVLAPEKTVALNAKTGFPVTGDSSTRLVLSPDGERLAWTNRLDSGGYRIFVFPTQTGKLQYEVDATEPVSAFSPDGKWIAFCGEETDTREGRSGGREGVWLADANTGERKHFLQAKLHPSNTRRLVFDQQGKRLALGHSHNWSTPSGWKGLVSIWDVETQKEIQVLDDHDFMLRDVAFSPDGQRIGVLGEGGELIVWDDGKKIAELSSQRWEKAEVNSKRIYIHSNLAFSPGGKLLAVPFLSQRLRSPMIELWDWQTGVNSTLYTHHEPPIGCLAFSADGRSVVTGDLGTTNLLPATLRIYDLRTKQPRAILKGHEGIIQSVVFKNDGTIISASQDGTVRFWKWNGT